MLLTLATFAAFVPQGPGGGSSTAPVVINEFSYDDASTDDKEFVEIYNRSNAAVDISGWKLQGEELGSVAAGSANGAFTFPSGTTINPGQYIVVGMAAVPNVAFTTTATVPAGWMENGCDGMTLRDATNAVIDGVIWDYASFLSASIPVPTWIEGQGLWGDVAMNDGAAVPQQGWTTAQRRSDGFDNNDNGCDFVVMQWTPGSANGAFNGLSIGYVQNFDGPLGSNIVADIGYSFVPGTIVDPAAVPIVAGTPGAFPPSPQGGNIGDFHDITGGGNMNALRVNVGNNYLVECYVFVKAGPVFGATEGESWAVGVAGTTDSFAHPADVPGTYYASVTACVNRAHGATGVAWMAYVRPTQTELYLVDMNNGGPGFTVLGGPIVATPGVNDGWQRLRIRVNGTSVVGNFGGNFGCDDGTRFAGSAADCAGQVYLQYRECILVNANMTPLLVDRLEVWGALNHSSNTAGTASPTNFGTPSIGTANGNPVLGNAGFQITGSGLVPNGISALLLGLGNLDPGQSVPGAPLTVQIYVNPVFASNLVFADGTGNGAYGLGLPCDNSLVGLPVTGQFIDYDPTLAFPLPLGSSQGLQLVVGND